MAIVLFTDFGSNDLYVGQLEAVLDRDAPGVRVVHLLHEAPGFDARASAHLLAALVSRMPAGHVYVAVVDPGVGGERDAVVIEADGNWLVGPDNGLLSVVAARAGIVRQATDRHEDFGRGFNIIYIEHEDGTVAFPQAKPGPDEVRFATVRPRWNGPTEGPSAVPRTRALYRGPATGIVAAQLAADCPLGDVVPGDRPTG